MNIALVHNPDAGRNGRPVEDLLALLRDAGHPAEAVPMAANLVEAGPVKGADMLVIAGGDGTVRHAALQFVGRPLPLAVLPLGTANNISKSLGVGGTPEEIVASWSRSRTVGIDVGLARGPWGERHFLEGIGIGLVGRSIGIVETIDGRAARQFADKEDKLQRDLAVFVALAFEFPPVHVACEADGEDMTDDFLLLEILNIRHAGPRIELAPRALPTDGRFDLVAATLHEREELKRTLLESLSDEKPRSLLTKRTASHIRMTVSAGELRIDDEVVLSKGRQEAKHEWVEVSMLPGALTFLTPQAVRA